MVAQQDIFWNGISMWTGVVSTGNTYDFLDVEANIKMLTYRRMYLLRHTDGCIYSDIQTDVFTQTYRRMYLLRHTDGRTNEHPDWHHQYLCCANKLKSYSHSCLVFGLLIRPLDIDVRQCPVADLCHLVQCSHSPVLPVARTRQHHDS